jgi:hypothetical protein
MPDCLTFAFHRRPNAQPCGRCPACLSVEPPPPAAEQIVGTGGVIDLAAAPVVSEVGPEVPAMAAAPAAVVSASGGVSVSASGAVLVPPAATIAATGTVTAASSPLVEITGGPGGWFDVTVDGGHVDRVKGRDAAEARAAELTTREDPDGNTTS